MPKSLRRIATKELPKFGQPPIYGLYDEPSAGEPARVDPVPHAANNVLEIVAVDEQQQVTTSENNQALLKQIEALSKEDKSEFLKRVQHDHEKIHTFELSTLRVSSHKVIADYPQVAEEKLNLIPSQYCKCNQCPIAHNRKEAFCCQSSTCHSYHNDHADQCVTKSEDFDNSMTTVRNEFDRKETQASDIMKNARENAYTEIANLLYGQLIDRTKRPRVFRPIPACVRKAVRRIFPDPDDHYEGITGNQEGEQADQLPFSERPVSQGEQDKMVKIVDNFDVDAMIDFLQLFDNEDDPHNHYYCAFSEIVCYTCQEHPDIVEAKLQLMTPHGFCQCERCPLRINLKEAFCCKSTKFMGYNVSRPNICVTFNEDIRNIIDDGHKLLEKEGDNAEVLSNVRGQIYTEIANKLYGICYNSKQNPRNPRDIPSCVRKVVREAFPDPGGNYSGRDISTSPRNTE